MSARFCMAMMVGAVLGLVGSAQLAAQTATIAGRITDADRGGPVSGARVEALRADGGTAAGTLTNDAGDYVLTVSPGVYTLVIQFLGYQVERIPDVEAVAGQRTDLPIRLTAAALRHNPVVVTAARREQTALETPASVSVVDSRSIDQRPASSPIDHIRGLPGVDISQFGLMQSNVVARGFNNVFSSALLTLHDYRITAVPSLRVNAFYMIPVSNDDMERIEVVRGPGAALYGPNSVNGVLHIITRSPLDEQGTRASISAGERSVVHGTFRHAGLFGENVGFKVSGQYFQGNDWEFIDPVEVQARAEAQTEAWRASKRALGLSESEIDLMASRIAARDFDIRRFSGEARVDVRLDDATNLVLSAGANQSTNIEMTGIGGAQAQDWRYMHYQARLRRNALFAQAFVNTSNAGDTYVLTTGEPIVDESRVFVAQVQHGADIGTRQSFTYGIDAQRTEPRTLGTINGRNEDDDHINELGGYVHSETRLAPRFDLVTAARVDYHNRLENLIFSPRAALVYRPGEGHNVRLTYNRAFSTPGTNQLFLDILAAQSGPFQIRALGVPATGLSFRRDCGTHLDGLCIRSPWVGLGAPAGFQPAHASDWMWDVVVALAGNDIREALGVDLSEIAPPTPADVRTELRRLNTTDRVFEPASASGVTNIQRLEPTISNIVEVGYKGLLGQRLLVGADVYYERRHNFIGPLIVETPNLFYNTDDLRAYLISQGVSAAQAGAVAANVGGVPFSPTSGVPLGTVQPDHEFVDPNSLVLTYRNFGEVDLWGTDLHVQAIVTDEVTVSGAYSYVGRDFFTADELGGLAPVALNAPQHKGSAGVSYRSDRRGLTAELQGRFVGGFPMNSGAYIGEVESYQVLDAGFGIRLPQAPGASLNVRAQNLLDHRHRQWVGAPELGRLVMVRLQYEF